MNRGAARAPAIVRPRRPAFRLRAAHLGLLADEPRGRRPFARGRRRCAANTAYAPGSTSARRRSADEPPRRPARDHHLGRAKSLAGSARRLARAAQRADIVVASHHWGLHQDVLAVHDRDRPRGDRRRRRRRRRARTALLLPVEIYRASRSSTASAASRSTPGTAAASTATGSACWRASPSTTPRWWRSRSRSCATTTQRNLCLRPSQDKGGGRADHAPVRQARHDAHDQRQRDDRVEDRDPVGGRGAPAAPYGNEKDAEASPRIERWGWCRQRRRRPSPPQRRTPRCHAARCPSDSWK